MNNIEARVKMSSLEIAVKASYLPSRRIIGVRVNFKNYPTRTLLLRRVFENNFGSEGEMNRND